MTRTVLFDRYRLLEPAGTGGSAEVWRALDEATGEIVAVKRLHPMVFADERARRRLQREFDALRALDEPHVVRVRDLRIGEREAALVLEFVDGPSLTERLAGQAPGHPAVDPPTAARIVSDVAAALAAAHAAGIVHRDVTPGNILLDAGGMAHLTDFGIAHASADATAVTATGQLMGTLRYLAPEQLRGGASTPASDLHGLAAVAYELVAGRPAYDATTPVQLAEAQDVGAPPIPRAPASVDAVIRSGLSVDPTARPSSVTAFAASLAAAVGDPDAPMRAVTEPIASMPVVDEQRAAMDNDAPRRLRGRRGVPAPVAAAVGLVLAVGLLAAATTLDRHEPPGSAVGASATPEATATPTATATHRPTARPTATPAAVKPAATSAGNGGGAKGDGKGKDGDKGKGHGGGKGKGG
jgi:eukaryotic-like serine/threonine-protein kinase